MVKDLIKINHRKPVPELSPYIRKISTFESDGKISFTQKLTPSPYNYISYNHKSIPVSIFSTRKIRPESRLMLAGIKTDEIYVTYNGELSQILFEFTASGFYYLFHHSPAEYQNTLKHPDNIFAGKNSTRLLNDLKDNENIDLQIKEIEKFLIRMAGEARNPVGYVEQSIKLIEKNHGCVSIQDIAGQVGICERQLNRRFTEITGISPKKFSRILQLHYLIYLIQQKKSPFQEIVYESLFYDRPHLNHSFKDLTGMTPCEFIKSGKHIAFEYFTNPPGIS